MAGPGSNPNWPLIKVWVNFADPGASVSDPVPFDPTNTNWVDITPYCKRIGPGELMHIERGRNYERAQTDTGVFSAVVDNSTGAFDPSNTASPFYPNVKAIRKVQVTATWAGTTYYLFHGRIENWPRVWKAAGFWGEVTFTARGILGSLSTILLKSAWVDQAVLDGALAIYRMNDPSGSVTAANSSPFQQNYAFISAIPGTTNSSTFSFGSNPGSGNLAGDPTGSLTLGAEAGADAPPPFTGERGYYLQTASSADGSADLFLDQNGGWTWEGWFLAPIVAGAVSPFEILWQNGDTNDAQINLYLEVTGVGANAFAQVNAVVGDDTTANYAFAHTPSRFSGGRNFLDGQWHQVTINFRTDRKTLVLEVDGLLYFDTAASVISYTSPTALQTIGAAFFTAGAGESAANMSFKNLAWYPAGLTITQVADHFAAGQGYPGDDTGTRIARILGYTPYPYSQLDVGNSFLGRMNIEAVNTTQAIEDVNDTEVGTIIESGDGYLVFKNRQSRNPTNASLTTFGETGAPYEDDLVIQQDPALIFTDVVVARDTGITITQVNTGAEADFFPRTLSLTSHDNTDTQAIYLSQYLLGQYKVGRDRVPSLTIVPSANSALWPVALGRDIGDRVTVRRANPGAPTITQTFYIEKITHDVVTGLWRTTYMMSSSALWDGTFILDDVTYGRLDDNVLGF